MRLSYIEFLSDERFDTEANMVYKVPFDKLPKKDVTIKEERQEVVDFEHETTLEMIVSFINHHQKRQVPRLKELRRYYEAKNNIKYRKKKTDKYRADNRIASDFARFITTFKKGVIIGKPVEYSGDEKIMQLIDEFNERSNEAYHNQKMVQDLVLFGRAYELPYRNQSGKETITKLDPEQTFVIYDTSPDMNSICAVHYYSVSFLDKKWSIIEIYGNDGMIYRRESKGDDFAGAKQIGQPEDTFVRAVSINEWSNNEERHGDSDAVLDSIDAYDLSQSELANFMQDSSDAYLVIVGNPDTGKKTKNGKKDDGRETLESMRKARILVLGDKKDYGNGKLGADPDAFYLKKEYDTDGAEKYKERLVSDILRFSFVVDFTDETLGGNQTGVGMKFKGWGNDNDRAAKENVIKKGIMRRLRLLASSWAIKETIAPENLYKQIFSALKSVVGAKKSDQERLYDLVNAVSVKFNPNVPQSTQELVENVQKLYGMASDQTVFELLESITGVSAEDEVKRVKAELDEKIGNSQHDSEIEQEEVAKGKVQPTSEE